MTPTSQKKVDSISQVTPFGGIGPTDSRPRSVSPAKNRPSSPQRPAPKDPSNSERSNTTKDQSGEIRSQDISPKRQSIKSRITAAKSQAILPKIALSPDQDSSQEEPKPFEMIVETHSQTNELKRASTWSAPSELKSVPSTNQETLDLLTKTTPVPDRMNAKLAAKQFEALIKQFEGEFSRNTSPQPDRLSQRDGQRKEVNDGDSPPSTQSPSTKLKRVSLVRRNSGIPPTERNYTESIWLQKESHEVSETEKEKNPKSGSHKSPKNEEEKAIRVITLENVVR